MKKHPRPLPLHLPSHKQWQHTSIPPLDELRARLGKASSHPIDLDGSANQQLCVDALTQNIAGLSWYAHSDNPPYYAKAPSAIKQIYLRPDLIRRLQAANRLLTKSGMELFLFDGWRPQLVQHYYRTVWTPAKLRELHPNLTERAIEAQAERYWATGYKNENAVPPNNPPPHSTGACVDLTMRHIKTKQFAYMGGLFDDPSPISHADALEGKEDDSLSFRDARANRRLLYWVLTTVGLTNYPNEWWHWSYGDQEWAVANDQRAALYGKWSPSRLRKWRRKPTK